MREEAFLLIISIIFKVFAIYSPGVEVTLTGDKLRFECEVREYFELEFLDLNFNTNISSIEFVNCLIKHINTREFEEHYNIFTEKEIFTGSKLKSIVIKSNARVEIHWHVNTLNNLHTLIYESNHYNKKSDACKPVTRMLQLDKFKSLKHLELIVDGSPELCPPSSITYSELYHNGNFIGK